MANSFRPLKLNCPFCEGARRDCRENIQTGLTHCRYDVSSVPGWRFVGTDALGFNMWAVDDGRSSWSDERKEEWKLKRETYLRQRETEKANSSAKLLTVEERTRQYRLVNANLTLIARHRQVLGDKRKLTDAEIDLAVELGALRTWNPGQRIIGISPSLAGVDPNTRCLGGVDGMAIYAFDPSGQITGAQLQPDNQELGKYIYLSSNRFGGNGPHLPNGELPLFVWKHPRAITGCGQKQLVETGIGAEEMGGRGENFWSDQQSLPSAPQPLCSEANPHQPLATTPATTIIEVWLCEGALKSMLVAFGLWREGRTDIAVIGTASAARYGEKTLQSYLTQIGALTVRLMPDAGAVVNPTIHKANQQTLSWCQRWGYDVTVGWWGQVDKTHPDIDELADFSAITYLSKEDFLSGYFQNSAYVAAEESVEEVEEVYKQLTQLTAQPWKEVNTPKLDLESLGLEPEAVYVIRSAKGTHKTNSLIPIIPKFKNVYAWFSRIALGREECNRIGVTWKDDLGKFTGTIKAGFCADSSYMFPPRHLLDNGLLLVDEADQVFEHIFGATCNKDGKRPAILAALQAQLNTVIAGQGIALFMSADITDKEVAYLKQLAPPGCPVRLIVNHYKPELGNVDFYISNTPDGVIEKLIEDLENRVPCFVIDDMRTGIRGCKSIASWIRSVHPEWADKIVEINSDTSGAPEIIEYLKNINTASLDTLLLCCSPSVVSGISIENGHFVETYGFYNGVMVISNCSQSLSRLRGAKSLNVWAAEKGLIYAADRSLLPEEIRNYYRRNYEQNAKHILAFDVHYNPLKDEWDSPHFDLYCKNAAYRNNCMSHLRLRLAERLDEEGYNVTLIESPPSDMVAAGLESAWDTIELTHARSVGSATILNDQELKALENNTLTPKQKLDVEKTFLLKSFGQELIDAMVEEHDSGEVLRGFAAMVLKNKRGEYKKQLDAFYLLTTTPDVALLKDLKIEQRQLDQGSGRFAADVRWHLRQRKAREFLGLPDFLNPTSWFGPADFAGLAQKAIKHGSKIKDALGLSIVKMTAGQIYGELMAQLGLELDKKWAPKLSAAGRRYKLRQITPESWRYAQLYVKYRESLLAESVDPATATDPPISDHPPVTIYSETIGGGDQGQSYTPQGVEPGAVKAFSTGDLDRLPDTDPVVPGDLADPQTSPSGSPGVLVSCQKFGRMFKFSLQRFIDGATAEIKSILTGELFQVPVSQLTPWKGAV